MAEFSENRSGQTYTDNSSSNERSFLSFLTETFQSISNELKPTKNRSAENQRYLQHARESFQSLSESIFYGIIFLAIVSWPFELIAYSEPIARWYVSYWRIGILIIFSAYLILTKNFTTFRQNIVGTYLVTCIISLIFTGYLLGKIPAANHLFEVSHFAPFSIVILSVPLLKRIVATLVVSVSYAIPFLYTNNGISYGENYLISRCVLFSSIAILSVILGHVFFRLRREDFFKQLNLREQKEEINYLATHDELTGMHNRRFLENRLQEEMDRARRYSVDLSIAFFRLNQFNSIRLQYGHLAGDRALKELGERVREKTRESDYACRFSGQEFAIILPETQLDGASELAARIMHVIHSESFPVSEGRTIQIDCSVGVAQFNPETDDRDDLISRAINKLET